jgi:lipoprotein-releasing system permease protein
MKKEVFPSSLILHPSSLEGFMYKLLLCWRYLRTRYLALVCIVSVMLGVATLIVVNSVMGGFSTKLKERLHGLLSDIVVETEDMGGFPNPREKMDRIRRDPYLNDRIEAMAGTMEVFAMMQLRGNRTWTKPVRVIGVDPESRSRVGGFQEFLINERNREDPSMAFQLDEEAHRRFQNRQAELWGWALEVEEPPSPKDAKGALDEIPPLPPGLVPPEPKPGPAKPPPGPPPSKPHIIRCAIVGWAIANYRVPATEKEPARIQCNIQPGDEVILTTVSGAKMIPVYDRFAVSDYIKTEMSDYDSNYVYVPLDHLQRLRGLDDNVTAIQIKLKDYADAKAVKERLHELFKHDGLKVYTWEDKQGALLAAISIEKGILNVLLFLIIAVAGFGILAIFSMIVVEKTRDIGILKALGASNGGVMKIFLGYGLLLGLVGAGLGSALGLTFAEHINEVEKFLSTFTGQEVFNRNIYYFDKIPVDIQPMSVLMVNLGAIAIAVLFSILPALRAALLHPVRALRFE